MRRVLLFPYHPDVDLIAEQAAELKGFSIVGVHSFQEDQSVVKAVNEKLGCTDNFTEMLKQCDVVLLLDNYRESKTEKYYEVIQAAVEAGKQIVVTPLIEQELNIGTYQEKYAVLQNIPEIDFEETEKEAVPGKIMHTIETPIITVFGMGKSCCKFENQILLKSLLDKEGYESVWISSNPLGALFGGYTMPDFLFDDHLAFEEKVMRFNKFVHQFSLTKNPDVFVIGVPEGISEFSAYEFNHFAEYSLVIGSAVSVDDAVLCTYFLPEMDVGGVEKMLFHCKERFGFPGHMISIGRTVFENAQEFQKITYLFLEQEYLQKNYKTAPNQPDDFVGVWETEKTRTLAEYDAEFTAA